MKRKLLVMCVLLGVLPEVHAQVTCGQLPAGNSYCDVSYPVNEQWQLNSCTNPGNINVLNRRMCEAGGGVWSGACSGLIDPPFKLPTSPYTWRYDISNWLLTSYAHTFEGCGLVGPIVTGNTPTCTANLPTIENGYVTASETMKTITYGYQSTGNVCNDDAVNKVETFRIAYTAGLGCPRDTYGWTSPPNTCLSIVSDTPLVGDQVDPSSGEKLHVESTLLGLGISDLLRIHYRAYGQWPPGAPTGLIGHYWRFEFDRRVRAYDANSLIVYIAGHEPVMLKNNGSGTYTSINITKDSGRTAVQVGAGYRIKEQDLSEWLFDSTGRLQSVNYPDGRSVQVAWQTDAVLLTDQNNRSVMIDIDELLRPIPGGQQAHGKRFTISDLSGRSAVIDSWDPGLVTKIQSASGVRELLYEDPTFESGLTGIKDESNTQYVAYAYSNDNNKRVASQAILVDGVPKTQFSFSYNFPSGVTSDRVVTMQNALQLAANTPDVQATNITVSTRGFVRRLWKLDKRCTDCGGEFKTRAHDGSTGQLLSTEDFNGNETQFLFDPVRNLETQRIEGIPDVALPPTQAAKRTIQTDWHPTLPLPTQKRYYNAQNVLEQTRAWDYDSRGNVRAACIYDPALSNPTSYACGSLADAPAGVRQTHYIIECGEPGSGCPSTGRLMSVDGPRTDEADITTFAYYGIDDPTCSSLGGACHYRHGDLKSVTNALGHVTNYLRYDRAGRLTRVQDARGVITDYTYNSSGRIGAAAVRANADGTPSSNDQTTSVTYKPYGAVERVTQPDGSFLEYVYDTAHRLVRVFDNLGNEIVYELDPMGNHKRELTKDAQGNIKRLLGAQFDYFSRIRSIINAPSAAASDFDAVDVQKTTKSFDLNGNLNELTEPKGNLNQFGWVTDDDFDELNRLKKVTQNKTTNPTPGINAVTKYAYDTRDNLRKVTDPKGLDTIYVYDGLDNLKQVQSPDAGTTVNVHDAAGNVLTRTDARMKTATMVYDELGRLSTKSFPDSSLNEVYTYDVDPGECNYAGFEGVGLLSMVTDASGTTIYCYDRFGRVASKTQIGLSATYSTSYTYTKTGRLDTVTYPSGNRVRYVRDATGRVTAVYWREFKSTEQLLVSNLGHLPFGPVSGITWATGVTQTRVHDQNYWIDDISSSSPTGFQADYTLNELGNISAISAGATQRFYGYDALSRLTEKTNSGFNNRFYLYDATGDRLSMWNGMGDYQSYTYPLTSHRLEEALGSVRVYDANGNLTHPTYFTRSGSTYSYGDHNRMTEVALNGETRATFHYNFKGERTIRNVEGKATFEFVFDESGRLIGEYSEQSSPPLVEYIWVDDLPVSLIYEGNIHAIETDHLGTPRRVMTAVGAKWSWDLLAEPFGATPPNEDPDNDGTAMVFNLRFPGQWYDQDTELNYNYMRDYEPITGRYVESDPIGLEGGISTYGYAINNPLGRFDANGLSPGDAFSNTSAALKDLKSHVRMLQPSWSNWSGWIFKACGGSCISYRINSEHQTSVKYQNSVLVVTPGSPVSTWRTHGFPGRDVGGSPKQELPGHLADGVADRGAVAPSELPEFVYSPTGFVPMVGPDVGLPGIVEEVGRSTSNINHH
ncbi:RHS repeat domain-containing protein [Ahniella affigens]|nr:RHS repeat protein [Ahniella affigens]